MSHPGPFDEGDDRSTAADAPRALRLARIASTALQVVMLTLVTVAAGLYVFPLE